VVVLYVQQEESVRRQMMRAQLASLHNQCARPPSRGQRPRRPPPERRARGSYCLSAVWRSELQLQEWRAPDLHKLSSHCTMGAQPWSSMHVTVRVR